MREKDDFTEFFVRNVRPEINMYSKLISRNIFHGTVFWFFHTLIISPLWHTKKKNLKFTCMRWERLFCWKSLLSTIEIFLWIRICFAIVEIHLVLNRPKLGPRQSILLHVWFELEFLILLPECNLQHRLTCMHPISC